MTPGDSRSRKKSRGAARRKSGPAVAALHLLSDAELRRIAEKIFKYSDADETEVEIGVISDALTRFANNTIHQNVAEQSLTVSVRTVLDGRTARATTNKTDDDSLRRVVATSKTLARSQPRIPGLLPMPGPQKYGQVSRYFENTAHASPADRARAVARVAEMAEKNRQTAAGIFTTGVTQSAIANTNGLFASHRQTRSEFSITILEPDSSGWAKANASDLDDIDPIALARSASEKSAASRNPGEAAPGKWTVILEPAAALDLVGFLFYDFAGTAVADQRSCFNKRMGKRVLGENITLHDDVFHPLQSGAPYDGEGMPRRKILLVDKGVPTNLVYSRATAKKMKARPTGHGFSLPNEYGEAPMNLVFGGGNCSVDEMVRSTGHGILVTRMWYIRDVDPYEKVLTGMTRDGTFLVRDGKIAGGVRNFRFNQGVLEMLSNVEAMGPAVRAAGEESFEMVVPPMKVRNFNFSEVTKF
ncbi:MAG TPA: TldD/PmbA family protein [Candidatus Dormibacteraeota bacterium]|nr:TldD/PmbA family protein [Candidatus Dormibacteraeota bacterium]